VPKKPRQFARALRKSATPPEDVLWQALQGRRFLGLKFRLAKSLRPVPHPCPSPIRERGIFAPVMRKAKLFD